MKIKYRKWKKTRVLRYSAYNFDAEPGDLMVSGYGEGKLFRLEGRRIGPMAAIGELYPREILPPINGMKAVIEDDDVYWVDKETYNHISNTP